MKITNYDFKGATYPPYKAEEITNESYEHLTFLTTYIIPLICITLDQIKFVIVLFFLLIVIGVIFIKMDLYFGNPTLALLGYKLYKIQLKDSADVNEIIIISRDKLSKGSSFKWMPITDNVWLAKEI